MIALILYSISSALYICQSTRRIMILVAIRLKENQEAPSELGLLEEERGLHLFQ